MSSARNKAGVVVLGAGEVGGRIASLLARTHDVTVVDRRPVKVPGARTLVRDVKPSRLDAFLSTFGWVVSAMPTAFGRVVAEAAIAARRPLVDLTYFAEDPFELDALARRAGVLVVPDCGLAPGLTNLLAGHLSGGSARSVDIRVGGIAADRDQDYISTWALEELLDSYCRPAGVVRRGKRVMVPALSGHRRIQVPGVGELEAFQTDGLRTLPRTLRAQEMSENTLRWPGHLQRIVALRDLGLLTNPAALAPLLAPRWNADPPADLVVVDVEVDGRRATLVERYREGVTALTRLTAATCAAVTRAVASGSVPLTGIQPLENLGANVSVMKALRAELRAEGVTWKERRA